MKFAWQFSLLWSIILPFYCSAQAAPIEDSYSPPAEIVIETPEYSAPTIVRGEEILEPYTNYEYTPPVAVAVRSLTRQEIKELKVPGGCSSPWRFQPGLVLPLVIASIPLPENPASIRHRHCCRRGNPSARRLGGHRRNCRLDGRARFCRRDFP